MADSLLCGGARRGEGGDVDHDHGHDSAEDRNAGDRNFQVGHQHKAEEKVRRHLFVDQQPGEHGKAQRRNDARRHAQAMFNKFWNSIQQGFHRAAAHQEGDGDHRGQHQ